MTIINQTHQFFIFNLIMILAILMVAVLRKMKKRKTRWKERSLRWHRLSLSTDIYESRGGWLKLLLLLPSSYYVCSMRSLRKSFEKNFLRLDLNPSVHGSLITESKSYHEGKVSKMFFWIYEVRFKPICNPWQLNHT